MTKNNDAFSRYPTVVEETQLLENVQQHLSTHATRLRRGANYATEKHQMRQAIADEPAVGGRLALWGRRLVGEALTQAQRVASERSALTGLISGTVNRSGMDLATIGRMLTRLVENHALRMDRLGLAS